MSLSISLSSKALLEFRKESKNAKGELSFILNFVKGSRTVLNQAIENLGKKTDAELDPDMRTIFDGQLHSLKDVCTDMDKFENEGAEDLNFDQLNAISQLGTMLKINRDNENNNEDRLLEELNKNFSPSVENLKAILFAEKLRPALQQFWNRQRRMLQDIDYRFGSTPCGVPLYKEVMERFAELERTPSKTEALFLEKRPPVGPGLFAVRDILSELHTRLSNNGISPTIVDEVETVRNDYANSIFNVFYKDYSACKKFHQAGGAAIQRP